jgi:quercetin dioxygenase-like cupin family protein
MCHAAALRLPGSPTMHRGGAFPRLPTPCTPRSDLPRSEASFGRCALRMRRTSSYRLAGEQWNETVAPRKAHRSGEAGNDPAGLTSKGGERMTDQSSSASATSRGAPRLFDHEPMLVRRAEATPFLWGDEESGQVADLIYGRGHRISAVTFSLGPGRSFGWSSAWKPLYDQHRFYYVCQGAIAIHDPETGEVAVASAGEAVTWQGSRYHFGYNVGRDEALVLDWFAPPDRAPDVPEITTMPGKRPLGDIKGGRYELLGHWPDARSDVTATALSDRGMTTVGPTAALHLVQGATQPVLVSILSSSEDLTAGTFRIAAGRRSDPEQHPGDEVVYCIDGTLHVHLPESGAWYEVNRLDCLYVPEDTLHEYWSYGSEPASAVFCVAPRYR